MLETLERHDTESAALAQAQGQPITSIIANTNHVIHVPSTLIPAPRLDPRRTRQSPPTPTSIYLLIPRAGTRVTIPTILSALDQGGPNSTPISVELRRDFCLFASVRRAAALAPGRLTNLSHPHTEDQTLIEATAQTPIQMEPAMYDHRSTSYATSTHHTPRGTSYAAPHPPCTQPMQSPFTSNPGLN